MLDRIQEWLPDASDLDLIDVFAEVYVELFNVRGLPVAPFLPDPPVIFEQPRKKWWPR